MTGKARLVAVIEPPLPITEFAARTRSLEAEHGPGLRVASTGGRFEVWTPGETCGCLTCDTAYRETLAELTGQWMLKLTRRMIVCDDCGNKRCPKATHHDQACSGSNAPGQAGSIYGDARGPSGT